MFNKKVVFVLGAGANEEVGLPFGEGFKKEISGKLGFGMQQGMRTVGDVHVYDAITAHVKNLEGQNSRNPYLSAARMLTHALIGASSVDEYLSNKRSVPEISFCGKLAIASTILQAERASDLFFDPREKGPEILPPKVMGSWYPLFWQLLHKNIEDQNLEDIFRNLTLIIFNYDRCIEHYLICQLQVHYGISEVRAFELLKTLNIFHPFGTVGNLPPQGQQNPMEFGGRFNGFDLLRISKGISTFHEKMRDQNEISKIKQLVQDAGVVVFLGFAFHTQNLDLIKPTGSLKQKPIFGTGIGISLSDKELILSRLKEKQFGYKKHTQIYLGCSCLDLFKAQQAVFADWKEV